MSPYADLITRLRWLQSAAAVLEAILTNAEAEDVDGRAAMPRQPSAVTPDRPVQKGGVIWSRRFIELAETDR
jgi:hypothetical protein